MLWRWFIQLRNLYTVYTFQQREKRSINTFLYTHIRVLLARTRKISNCFFLVPRKRTPSTVCLWWWFWYFHLCHCQFPFWSHLQKRIIKWHNLFDLIIKLLTHIVPKNLRINRYQTKFVPYCYNMGYFLSQLPNTAISQHNIFRYQASFHSEYWHFNQFYRSWNRKGNNNTNSFKVMEKGMEYLRLIYTDHLLKIEVPLKQNASS